MGMVAYHMHIPTRVLGGSTYQSQSAYREFRSFLDHGFIEEVRGEVLQSRTTFNGGGSVELLTQSDTSVRSPHVPFLFLDELDEFNERILKAAKFIPQTMEGVTRKMIQASTRHRPMGIMSQEWEAFKGKKLIWCLMEIMEACGPEWSCSTCNLAAACPGKEKMGPEYKGRSGYYTVDDARELRDSVLDEESWEAEALCGEPRSEGQIYRMLNPAMHTPGVVSYNPHLPVYRVFDYGAADSPCVCQWWQSAKEEGRNQARMFAERRWKGIADRLIVDDLLEFESDNGYNNWISGTLIPMDGASLRNEFSSRDISTEYPDQDVAEGIGTMRNLLTPNSKGTVGIVMDQVASKDTWNELRGYHMKNGKIVKKEDHGPDTVRYFVQSMDELKSNAGSALLIFDSSLKIGV